MVLGVLGNALQTIVDVARTVTGWAPKPLKIVMFLIIGIGAISIIVNWFVAAPYVCSEDEVYEADSIFWAYNAKSQEPHFEFVQDTSEEFKDIASNQQAPHLEDPALIDYITDQDYAFVSFTQYGSFLIEAGDVVPRFGPSTANLPNEAIVMALPHTYFGEDLTTFSDFYQMLADTGIGILQPSKTAKMQICQVPYDEDLSASRQAQLDTYYGQVGPGDCFLKSEDDDVGGGICPWKTTHIASVKYNLDPKSADDTRDTVSTSPGATTFTDDQGTSWGFNVEFYNPMKWNWWGLGSDEPKHTLDECPQNYRDGDNTIFLEPNPVQFEEGTFRTTEVETYPQNGYVKAKYVSLSKEGIDLLTEDDGSELRHTYMQKHKDRYDVVREQDGSITYGCDEDQNVQVLFHGIPIFEPVFILLFLFLIGLLTFLIKYIL
jgi:hypothetical protein